MTLNRPLERTVILDIDPDRFQLQPDNGIALKPWTGSKGDETANELVAMIPFLEAPTKEAADPPLDARVLPLLLPLVQHLLLGALFRLHVRRRDVLALIVLDENPSFFYRTRLTTGL
jgi:hypothetical protein